MVATLLRNILGPIKRWILPTRLPYTQRMVKKHCRGFGMEIGPGPTSYTPIGSTIYLDKFGTGGNCPPSEIISGRTFVAADAQNIPAKPDSFDFLFSAHCLEHCPDIIRVLKEWMRILKRGGTLFLVLPHVERTFDRGRPKTTLEHHLEDYREKVDHRDQTHWREFEEYSIPQYDHHWKEDSRNPDGSWNFPWMVQNGHFHFHVWTEIQMVEIVEHLGGDILLSVAEIPDRPDSFMVVARKT